jgi:hypothetical protein
MAGRAPADLLELPFHDPAPGHQDQLDQPLFYISNIFEEKYTNIVLPIG